MMGLRKLFGQRRKASFLLTEKGDRIIMQYS